MPYTYDQLVQRIAALTERLNLIEESAKKTGELPLQENLDKNSLIRVSKNGLSEHVSVEQVLDKQNNLIREKYVFQSELSGQGSLESQVVDVLNSNPQYSIEAVDLMDYLLPVSSSPTGIIDVYVFRHKRGKGTYGIGGTTLSKNDISKGIRTERRQDVVPLGDIGTSTISDYINGTGPYTEIAFTVTISGVDKFYIYRGPEELFGYGNYQTTEADFQDMTVEPDSAGKLYDDFHSADGNALADFGTTVPLTEKFYVLEAINEEVFYFASKTTNVEDFVNSRIYIRANGEKRDLGLPVETRDGYSFWDLGSANDFPNVVQVGVAQAFQFWLRNKNNPNAWPKKTIVGGQPFNYYPLPSNATGAPIAGEPAKNGWKDNGDGTWGFINEMVYVSGDPALFSSWNIIT